MDDGLNKEVKEENKIGNIIERVVFIASLIFFIYMLSTVAIYHFQATRLTKQIEASSYIVEDTSIIWVVGKETGSRGARSYFNIMDEDGVLGSLPTSVLSDLDGNEPKVGEYVKVNRDRYFEKETNKELRRVYTLYINE